MFKFRKAGSDVLNDLDAYLQLIGDEPVRWLERQIRSWCEFSYDELADLIASGDTQLINWQSRYAQVVNERFNPLWLSAIQAASHAATRGRITIDDSDVRVKEFLRTRAAEFVRELSDESKRAVANVILYGQSERMSYRQIAQLVRPLIGLNSRQVQANVNYRQRIYNKLVDAGLSPSTADTRAGTSASKYAAKQHRFRAETIVHTELARAYNRGAYDGVKAAIDARLMSHCEMIWSTAGTNRVCSRCLSLKDTVVGRTDEQGVQLPPLHPRCRCVIVYRESSRPRGSEMFRPKPSPSLTYKPVSEDRYQQLIVPLKKMGVTIHRDEESERHLDFLGVEASNLGTHDVFFRRKVSISAILEETHHVKQNRRGMNDDKDFNLRTILNEIDAKEYLLRVTDKYGIPREEIEATRIQLAQYKRDLEEYFARSRGG